MQTRVEVPLYYRDWGSYNNPDKNERRAELPIAFWFLNHYAPTIELGEVTPFYEFPKHRVFDLLPEHDTTVKMDALKVDYTGLHVLSISTIEHIGFGDYGNEKVPHLAYEALRKIASEALHFLITFPVGFNRELEEDIAKDGFPYSLYVRDAKNAWKCDRESVFDDYFYGRPYSNANALCILTDLWLEFVFKEPVYARN